MAGFVFDIPTPTLVEKVHVILQAGFVSSLKYELALVSKLLNDVEEPSSSSSCWVMLGCRPTSALYLPSTMFNIYANITHFSWLVKWLHILACNPF